MSLDYKNVFKGNAEFKMIFDRMNKIRNQQIAHSDDYLNSLIIYFAPDNDNIVDLRFSHIKWLTGEQIISVAELKSLVGFLIDHVKLKKNILHEKLVQELKEKGLEYYLSKSKEVAKEIIVTTADVDGKLIALDFVK